MTGLSAVTLSDLYAEHIMRNVMLDELQAGSRADGRNFNNPRYVDDTTLMAESEEELKSLLMRVKKESERAGLRIKYFKKTKIMASSPITAWQMVGEKAEVVTDFLFLGSKITANGDFSHEIRSSLIASWQQSDDRLRQCAEKQKHYSADKDLYSQGCGFPSGHIQL